MRGIHTFPMPVLLYNTPRPEFSSFDFSEVALTAAGTDELERYLFVVPSARAVRELERTLLGRYAVSVGRPMERVPLYTIASFITEFYGKLQPSRRDVSPEVSLALMQAAAREAGLEYFARQGGEPSLGVVEKLARVINGVRADGIMPSDFEKDIEYADAHRDDRRYDVTKLRDLHNTYAAYLRRLNRRWVDRPGKIAHVNTALFQQRDATFRRAFPGVHTVLINGFSEFTQPELAMLTQLGLVDGLSVMIYFDYAKENGPLYGNYEEVHDKLVTAGFRSLDLDPLETDIPEEQRRPFRHHMRKNLFRTDERIENGAFDHMLDAYGFFDREEEAQGVAALAKSLVVDGGIAANRICIATFAIDTYAELLRESLAAHGVPATITAGFPLGRNGLVTALMSALAIVANGYDRRDVIRAVTSPYLDFGLSVDAAALTEIAGRLRIRRGRAAWERRIRDRIVYLEPRLSSIADDDDRRSVELELESLQRALLGFGKLVEVMREFDRRMTPREFREAFLQLAARVGAPRNVLALRTALDARSRTPQDWQRVHDEMERDTRALAAFMRVLDEMTEFFEDDLLHRAERRGGTDPRGTADVRGSAETGEEERRPLDFYLDGIRTAVANARYTLREKHDYGVLVAPISGLGGLTFDAVILCGLVDGEFPSTYVPETFLGKPLPRAEDRQLRRERVQFYTAVTAFNRRLVLTYPRFAGDKALVRSSFLDAFLRITTAEERGHVIELEELRVLRDRARHGTEGRVGTRFLEPIATLESLAEEAGAALWSAQPVPRIADAEGMLAHLAHTAAVERERASAVALGDASRARAYRGMVADALNDEERDALEARRGNPYSASQLELYARCPFKFFARRVLNANAPASFDVSLTPLERGLLLHKVLFELYTELRADDALPITAEQSGRVLERARALAQREIDGIVFDHPYWRIDKERILGSGALDGLLEQWIGSDARRTDTEASKLTPGFFEVSFGGRGAGGSSDATLSSDEGLEVHGLRVRGKVDRVEIFRSGDEVFFAVADYKTGVPPSRTEIRDGTSLQLMIYLEVVRTMLSEHYNVPLENVKPAGGIYYVLNARSVETETKSLFVPNELKKEIITLRASRHDPDTVEELVEMIGGVFARAAEYVDGIAGGAFPVTPHDVNKVCRGCEYQPACRVSQLKMPNA